MGAKNINITEKNGFISQVKKLDMDSLSELRMIEREEVQKHQEKNHSYKRRR